MRLEGFIIAGLAGLAIVGACGQGDENTHNGAQPLDVHDGRLMPNQCEHGLYEFRCDDGAWEVRTLEEIEAGDVCHVLHVKAQTNAFILERVSSDEKNCVITDRETLRVSRIVPDVNSTNDSRSRYYVQVVKAPGSSCNLTEGFVQAKNVKVLAPNGQIYPSELSFPLLDWEENSLSPHDAWIREYKQKRRYTDSQCHNGPAQPWSGGSWSAPSGSYIPGAHNGGWGYPSGSYSGNWGGWMAPSGSWTPAD